MDSPRTSSDGTPTEKEKMAAGQPFFPFSAELKADYGRAQLLLRLINGTPLEVPEQRLGLLEELLGSLGRGSDIKPPFRCDYGFNIHLGQAAYINSGCTILDSGRVQIGNHVFIGPGVHIYAVAHPTDPVVRRTWLLEPRAVTVGDDVWIGGGAILCPGVTIGAGTVVGAGSVVTRDLPAAVVAAGNPCRPIRPLEAGPESLLQTAG